MPLILLKSAIPFSPAHQQAMQTIFAQWPERVRKVNQYVRQVPREEWRHGTFRGWSNSGSIELKAGEWQKIPGLFAHEGLHAIFQVLMTLAQQDEWAAWCAKHGALLPTDYAHKNPDEAMAESGVAVYRRPLPKGYRAAGPELTALVKRFAEGVK